MFNVLSESPFESVFNPSRRVHLPEPRLFSFLFSSLVASLHLLHELLEVLPFERPEFLLVLFSLSAISLCHTLEESDTASNVVARPFEEVYKIESLRIISHCAEAAGKHRKALNLVLDLGDLSFGGLHFQVNLGGFAVVNRPLDVVLERLQIVIVV